MKHDMFDLLEDSALVDLMPDLDEPQRHVLTSSVALFFHLHSGIGNIPKVHRSDRVEYTKFVASQIRA